MNFPVPGALAALTLALALAGCGSKEPEAPAPRPVVAMPAKADASLPAWTLPGEVQARYSTPLSFRVGGKIVERLVRPVSYTHLTLPTILLV